MAAKKTKGTKVPSISDLYWHHVLTEGSQPRSVYAFCQLAGIEEATFYEQASSFDAIEADYWKSCIAETIQVLDADEDYADYDTQQKLLSFYYTFFAHVQRHRSRLVERFPCIQQMMPSSIRPMRSTFTAWAEDLIQQGIENGDIADRKKLNDLYPKGLFEQLRFLIDYYKKDTSESFQDTDALVEKSVRFFTDSARSGVLDSALDLARFMLRRVQLPN